ncbi:autophagy-related protein 22-like protein [Lobosporangium transversale]|uniref:Autophagy-related protein n=1 Tax=Lobosporangium transversale TaxID=64571 RepID=A0A1Y2GVP8_9FUNG|nr:autophagy-related protein 22-like protein [Lobosporangium transversale]ORZ26337.1 autophagy-related protein 22-like protein [Lobosporangium transversale]|eukprot:XP_021884102.1 autophagy-related protein 22-like protein [Lobosporangium transversale]
MSPTSPIALLLLLDERGLGPFPSNLYLILDDDALTGSKVPLKKTELWAWYFQNATYCAYGWLSATMIVPLLIQDIAASGGVEASDHSIPCNTNLEGYKCVKRVFGEHYLDPGTISLYISSLSAIVSFFVSLSIAAVAGHGAYKKKLLFVFALLGCIISLTFFLVRPSTFWLAAVLSPLGWTCYNVTSVFSNAFLPIYVRVHPLVLEANEKAEISRALRTIEEKSAVANATADTTAHYSSNDVNTTDIDDHSGGISSPLPKDNVSIFSTTEQRKVEEQVSNDLSAWCMGAANVGSVIIHGVCIGISRAMGNSLLALQVVIAFTGVWWLMWTLAVMPWLDARPGPPLPKGQNWIVYSWSQIVRSANLKTFKSMRQLSQVTKFIVAWFILSDGVNTVTTLLYVITYQDLHFSHTKSVAMTIVVSTMAFFGGYGFLFIRQIWKLSTKFMLMLTIGLYAILTSYFVIPTYFTTTFGLRHEWEVWITIVYLGLIISTFFCASRVMMAELCPEGDESEWFSLFQLADKGSSWIGPFVTGAIESATGEFRTGFWFPLALFAVGAALLLSLDVDKGKDEAISYKQQHASHQLFSDTAIPHQNNVVELTSV